VGGDSRARECWGYGREGEKNKASGIILTSASLEPVLVPEGREGVCHHLREL